MAKKRSSKRPTKKRSAKRAAPPKAPKPSGPQRLQRLLAAAGYGSRRQCEEMIEELRVEVDGEIVSKLGTSVDPKTQKIFVDGVLLRAQKKVYYAVNKPTGFVTTNSDPKGRPRVIDLVPRTERVFPVGRLDLSSEGLIILTNDGDLAQTLAHPKHGVRKVYRVTVAGKVEPESMRKMREGVYIAEGLVRVEGARILKARPRATEMEISLREGKNREIRRILARMGHKVQTLRRIAIGTLRLGDMPSGAYRKISREEVKKLVAAAELSRQEVASDPRPRKPAGAKKRKTAGKRSTTDKKFGGKKSSRSAKTKRPAKKKRSRSKPEFDIKLKPFSDDADARIGSVIGGDGASNPKKKRTAKKKTARAKPAKKKTGRNFGKKRGGRRK